MNDLLVLARQNDLPPKWEGYRVVWDGWHDMPYTSIEFHTRQRDVCVACGGIERSVRNTGRYTIGERSHTGELRWWRLTALRCPECKHDQVYDHRRVTWWDLEPSDYDDSGSYE